MNVKDIKLKDIEIIENVRVSMRGSAMIELMSSIKQHGLLQPIGVSATPSGKYILVYGHRRLTACQKLGWNIIPAIIGSELELKEHLLTNVTENLQRQANSPLELGRICNRLIKEIGMTKQEISARLSVSQNMVTAALIAYGSVPFKLRENIVFMPAGGGSAKNGKISASVVNRVIGISRKHEFSKPVIVKIMEAARTNELSGEDIKILGRLIDQGSTPDAALKELKNYRVFRVDAIVNTNELESRLKSDKMTSINSFIQAVLYGEVVALTRPSIIKKGK